MKIKTSVITDSVGFSIELLFLPTFQNVSGLVSIDVNIAHMRALIVVLLLFAL